jgi:hypothetical protein
MRCTPLYVWNFGREFHEVLIVEVVLVFEQQGKVRLQTYEVAYRPFDTRQLQSLLLQAGFSNLKTDWTPQANTYRVVAGAEPSESS